MTKLQPPVNDSSVYTHRQLALVLGRNERWAKEFIRDLVSHADVGNGLLVVSGRNFREAIERMSDLRTHTVK